MPHYAYILTNHTRMFYVGMTDDIRRRTFEHKTGFYDGSFTDQYRVDQLVYYEELPDGNAAMRREKQLKGWIRKKKIALIESMNPKWIDLSDRWFTGGELESGIIKQNSTLVSRLQTGVSPTPS